MSEVDLEEVKDHEHEHSHEGNGEEVVHEHEETLLEHAAHEYDFMKSLKHHTLPWPAWEIAHKPLLVFNSAKYADLNYDYFAHKPEYADATPTADQLAWASDYVVKVQGYRGEEGVPYNAQQLAKAMVVGESKAIIGTFPKSLSFVNHLTFFGGVALVLMALFVCVLGRRKADQLKPKGRVQNMIEAVTLYIRDEVVRPSIHHGDGWTAHFTALFLAVLSFNLFGLIPGGGAASAHIPITAAFAVMTLLTMLVFGMKEQGIGTFWVTLVPVPFTLAPMGLAIWLILAVIEVAGLIIKPVALAIRLFANMFAGHVVILSFTSLFFIVISAGASDFLASALGGFGIIVAIAIFLLKILVSFIQAYVFTLLSAIFVGASVHPDH